MNFKTNNYNAEEFDRTMVKIPGGKFIFGLTKEQKIKIAKKYNVHPDMLYFHSNYKELEAGTFWMDKHPVTRGQFLRFMKKTGYKIKYNGWLVGWSELTEWPKFNSENYALPMVGVNSIDAENYAKWLGKRLPTEIEYERAFRGNNGSLYPWGDKWSGKYCFKNPGNISLQLSIPAGTYSELKPYGLSDFGIVMEWVKMCFQPQSKNKQLTDNNPYMLAGGSFRHIKEYSFLPTNRSSWHYTMRIYNSGFRCVSDKEPKGLIRDPGYRIKDFILPAPLRIKKEFYLKEKIKLVPFKGATFMIFVPWFPESVWVLDCPEINWDEFGGAGSWPSRPKKNWYIDWKTENNNTHISYIRRKSDKEIIFNAWTEGAAVKYRIETKNVSSQDLLSFCLKTLSPFFSSQERINQVKISGKIFCRFSYATS